MPDHPNNLTSLNMARIYPNITFNLNPLFFTPFLGIQDAQVNLIYHRILLKTGYRTSKFTF